MLRWALALKILKRMRPGVHSTSCGEACRLLFQPLLHDRPSSDHTAGRTYAGKDERQHRNPDYVAVGSLLLFPQPKLYLGALGIWNAGYVQPDLRVLTGSRPLRVI
jgi:hypothetical protein